MVRDVYSPTTQSQYASQHVDSQGYANPAAFAARDASQEVSVQDDDELFSKAFERVEADVRVNEEMIFGGLFVSQERPAVCEDPSLSQPRIGSDRILDESQQKDDINHDGKDDSDELARTAGKLLENVKDDTSKKFAGSNFLSLMRQLRDREVRIENDHFVDVSLANSCVALSQEEQGLIVSRPSSLCIQEAVITLKIRPQVMNVAVYR